MRFRSASPALLLALLFAAGSSSGGESFRVATFNLDNYLAAPAAGRPAKSPEARAKIRETLRALQPDVLALQEIGGTNALLELRASLKTEGLDFPFWEHVAGFDTNIHVAVLSRFPFRARHPHPKENFLLRGRRFQVSRGFAEVDVQVNDRYTFTLITAHLKSRREVPEGDQAELREAEAKRLREIIDARLTADTNLNLVVLGDFNDTKDSRTLKLLVGRGKSSLRDTRPAERNGDDPISPASNLAPRNITWTHYYGKEDTYSRIDYLLLSRGMAWEWITNETHVFTQPNWGIASDHRPIVAGFAAEDR